MRLTQFFLSLGLVVSLLTSFMGCQKLNLDLNRDSTAYFEDHQNESDQDIFQNKKRSNFYSAAGIETKVQFEAVFKTSNYTIEELKTLDSDGKKFFEQYQVFPTIKFLFGPLTLHSIGGMSASSNLKMHWDLARSQDSKIVIPYSYEGVWILNAKKIKGNSTLSLPLPYNAQTLNSLNWLLCTDSEPDHQTESFFWYFWDPRRAGCDHILNQDYQLVTLQLSHQTENSIETYPEYLNMIRNEDGTRKLKMTYAFGYVSDVDDANPQIDLDYGMSEYRKFIRFLDKNNKYGFLKKSEIFQREYLNPVFPDKQIGYRYSGYIKGVFVEIKVVTSANIDQMELFAQSYAHHQDAFFSWFGHSRVGSGFDADQFSYMLSINPTYYSVSKNYQLVYWAGCNSYSYYTTPFFLQKAVSDSVNDPRGTKKLDILANGLPSLFSFNADNAIILHTALMDWDQPTSYQSIVKQLESRAARSHFPVLVNILGDEDNQK